MRYIRRQLEKQVLQAVKGFPAVVLTWPRRAGAAVAGISRRAVTTKQPYQAPKGHNDENCPHTISHCHRTRVPKLEAAREEADKTAESVGAR